MNFSDPTSTVDDTKAAIQSLQDWWKTAGVDLDYSSEPLSLLAEPLENKAVPLTHDVVSSEKQNPRQAVTETPKFERPNEDYPADYEAFQGWIKNPKSLLESKWAREFVLPDGCLEPQIMIISSMPEARGVADQKYYSSDEGILLKNMMSAIGVDWDNSFRSALSFGRTIDGRLTNEQAVPLVKRALHLISLVKPKQIIMFGDTTSRAFFGEDLLSARKKKQYINHISSKTNAIVTFHPRILLERPELKAEAWKDLQMLTRIVAP